MNHSFLENKIKLGFLPTPLHNLPRLQSKMGKYNFYVKRDDLTGLAGGGNKTRKLEYLLAEAIAMGADTIITAGAQQSNHCRQTAAACAQWGLSCHLLLGGNKPHSYNGNLLLSHLLGASIHFTGEHRKGEDLQFLKSQLEADGKKCYIVPYGGSNFTGMLGYVNAMFELKEQIEDQNITIDYIFFASSSGGTQAGIAFGNALSGLNTKLMPVAIDKSSPGEISMGQTIAELINEAKIKFEWNGLIPLEDLHLLPDYNQSGYGVLTSQEAHAIGLLAATEGILLDPVYTGRAFYAMLHQCRQGLIPEGSNILFWHTGGLPANFEYADRLMHYL